MRTDFRPLDEIDPVPVVAPSRSDRVSLPHVGALDGLRGLAVIAVLVYHQHKLSGGFGWAKGGYLGVSAFFTLSGYLITNLLLHEHDSTGTVSLRSFWARRVRRLLPAAIVAVVGIALYAWLLAPGEQFVDLRGDLLGALGYVANWRFLSAGTSYATVNGEFSPVLHFWSLAIEEQFYVVWPLVVFGVLRWKGRAALGWVAGTMLVASAATTIVLAGGDHVSTDHVYFGTHTRAAELLVGAVLAVVFPLTRAVAQPAAVGRRLVPVGLGAAIALAVVWATLDQQDESLYRGGLVVHAIVVAALMVAAVVPGVVGRVLSWRPLRAVGLVSYGLYLYHWPVYFVLDEDRTETSGWFLLLVRLAAVSAIAAASYRLIERPIRQGVRIVGRRAWLAIPVSMALAGGAVVVVTADPPDCTVAFCDVDVDLATDYLFVRSPGRVEVAVASADAPTIPAEFIAALLAEVVESPLLGGVVTTPVTLIVGDSGTFDAAPALSAAFASAGSPYSLETAFPGIGLTNGVLDWRTTWPEFFADHPIGLVIVMLGGWDLEYLQMNGPDAYGAVVDEAIGTIEANGAKVLWLSVLPGGSQPDTELNAVYEAAADRHPGVVEYLDVAPVFQVLDGSFPREVGNTLYRKPDGWHLCPAGAAALASFVIDHTTSLNWSAPAGVDWFTDPWSTETRYDDPPGGCLPS